MTEQTVCKTEAVNQVRQMGKLTAGLYYHLSREIIAAVGPDKAKDIISKAVWAYGTERGAQQRDKVLQAGHEHVPENYGALPDLPSFGWEVEKAAQGENATHIRITYCPFAEYWLDKDFAEFGRLYCLVDQAKFTAFHPDSDLVHLKNVLDGDDYCEMVCRRTHK
ncbi:MAG: L-2-amino-thiazoline-4-carboxylic acid hydrolase [Negativicutes bacterium]|nr:L-2-amino-thiazoline-4-carboxylic acid hydrolase [Negativicutes bacterium]